MPFRAVPSCRQNHFTDSRDTIRLEEHVLSTAQADTFRTELDSLLGVARGIRIGADAQTAGSVSPAHEASKLAGDGRFNRRNLAIVDVAGRAVEGDEVTLVVHLVANGQGLCFFVNLQRAAADDSRAPMPRATTAA